MRICQNDYFYRSFNNFYVLCSGNFRKRRIVNARIRIKDCVCAIEKEKSAFKAQDKDYLGYLKLNFRIDLEKLEEKIFKTRSEKKSEENKNENNKNKNYSSYKNFNVKDFKKANNSCINDKNNFNTNTINENYIPECALVEKENKADKAQELRPIANINSHELSKKLNFTNSEISDFFISNYEEENESNIFNTPLGTEASLITRSNKNRNYAGPNKINIDLFNEDFSEDDQEGETIDIQNVQKLIFKLKERYKIIKIAYEIFEFNLSKSLKKGEIIGNPNDKLKCFPTIITKQETFFLKIPKELFEATLDELNKTSIFKTFSNFALSPIFKHLLKTQFYRLFFKSLMNVRVHKNEKIVHEGDFISDLVFIKEGSFVLKIKKSIVEINEIIKKLTRKKTCENEEEENDKIVGIDKFKFIYFFNFYLFRKNSFLIC
jgi:hypothetical protein